VARLVPVRDSDTKRKLGAFVGLMTVPEDFDVPLPEDLLAAFEGKTKGPKNKK
jgi:hypothetical protein